MQNVNPRIHTVLPKSLYQSVERLARENRTSLSYQVAELVSLGMDFLEDLALSELAERRLRDFNTRKAISHEKFWEKVAERRIKRL